MRLWLGKIESDHPPLDRYVTSASSMAINLCPKWSGLRLPITFAWPCSEQEPCRIGTSIPCNTRIWQRKEIIEHEFILWTKKVLQKKNVMMHNKTLKFPEICNTAKGKQCNLCLLYPLKWITFNDLVARPLIQTDRISSTCNALVHVFTILKYATNTNLRWNWFLAKLEKFSVFSLVC